mmetsp:Transcript_451/g.1534  ORF Transcript_451/g.1534 Transcript_451/m.1534 type:complete len:295 (-) Transcript_451:868-1752(-)
MHTCGARHHQPSDAPRGSEQCSHVKAEESAATETKKKKKVEKEEKEEEGRSSSSGGGGAAAAFRKAFRACLHLALALALVRLSVAPLANMLSPAQVMNTSFDQWRLVNTYGAFGSITKVRTEVVIEGTRDVTLAGDAPRPEAAWLEYEFACKPGAVDRRPCWLTPFHLRLDWLAWFAAFGDYRTHPWLPALVARLLASNPGAGGGNDPVKKLLAKDPFEGGPPPRFIRVAHYKYSFPKESPYVTGVWWDRERLAQDWLPPLSLDNADFRRFLQAHGFDVPRDPRREPIILSSRA